MPRRRYPSGPSTRRGWPAALALALLAAPPVAAQSFTRVLDPAINAVADESSAASWVDVDGDGDLDLFVTTWSAATPNLLFLNNGLGGFTRAVIPALNASVTEAFGSSWADADGDGRPDLYVSQLFSGGGTLFQNLPGPSLAPVAASLTGAGVKGNASWADVDLDGDPDLVLACLNGTGGVTTPNRLFINQGGLVFAERDSGVLVTTLDTHHTATWADFDDDGDPDLFFATGGVGSTKRDRLYQNMLRETGMAWFRPITTGSLATDLHDSQLLSWADFDNDGDLDCYVLNYTTLANLLYRNDGGSFTRITTAGPIVTDGGASHGCAWGDFDNDGDLDVYVVRDNSQTNRYYRNNGNGTFTSVTTGDFVTRPNSDWSAAAGDLDRDGDLDLFVPVRSPALAGNLYRNDLAPGSHWLELRCEGTVSNRSALGTRVRLKARIGGADRWQMREIATGTTYGGQHMLDVHFGLGDATVADSIEIRWPSGIRQVMTSVAVDRVLSVLEDASTAVTASTLAARVTDGRVDLEWEVSAPPGSAAGIERSLDGSAWEARSIEAVDGSRRVRYAEPAPSGAARARYRLRLADGAEQVLAGEVEVALEAAPGFALRVAGGLAGEPLVARLALPRAAEIDLELFDLSGRRVGEPQRLTLGAGTHEIALDPARRLPPGLLWVMARAGGESRRARAVKLR